MRRSKTKTVAAATWAFMTEIRLRFALSSEEERRAQVSIYTAAMTPFVLVFDTCILSKEIYLCGFITCISFLINCIYLYRS